MWKKPIKKKRKKAQRKILHKDRIETKEDLKMSLSPEEKKEKLKTYPDMFSRIIVGGININTLLDSTGLVIGAGGLGTLVSEMLARTGIGELKIVDRDTVEESNFNRLGFTREEINQPKAKAVATNVQKLRNQDHIDNKFHINVQSYEADIVGWPKLQELIEEVDVVFSCLDNFSSRNETNYYAMEQRTPLIDGATSRLGFGGTIITVIPDPNKPCYECITGEGMSINVNNVPRIGHCDASLANVMATVASIQVSQSLSLLLNDDNVSPLIKLRLKKGIALNEMKAQRRENCQVHKKVFGNE